MIKYILITTLIFLTAPLAVIAGDKAEEIVPVTCETFEEEIRQDIGKLGSCWEDKECITVDFGYPWQRSNCSLSIVSGDEATEMNTIIHKIVEFNKICIFTNAQLKEKYEEYEKIRDVKKCYLMNLVCLHGKCKTYTDVITQDNDL